MKTHSIIFSGPMILAIQNRKKTQTRRVMKPQPFQDNEGWWHFAQPAIGLVEGISTSAPDESTVFSIGCPYGQIGDELWVRETWRNSMHYDGDNCPAYKADMTYRCGKPIPQESFPLPWKSPIYMPRLVSRITLTITNVRAEFLQNISEADAMAEGIERLELSPNTIDFGDGPTLVHPMTSTYKEAYIKEWDKINAKRGYSWSENWWVWAISFKVKQ